MKNLLRGALVTALILISTLAQATTYTHQATWSLGGNYTGEAGQIFLTVYDASDVVKISRAVINTVAGSIVGGGETTDNSAVGSGTYRVRFTVDTSWSFPLRVHFDDTNHPGFAADIIVLAESARQIVDGYTNANGTKLTNITLDGSNNVKSTPQTNVTVGSITSGVTLPNNCITTNAFAAATQAPVGFLTNESNNIALDIWGAQTTVANGLNGSFGKGINSFLSAAPSSWLDSTSIASITTSIFSHPVETGVTFGQLGEMIGSYLAGNANFNTGVYYAVGNNTTARMSFTVVGGVRTVTLTP